MQTAFEINGFLDKAAMGIIQLESGRTEPGECHTVDTVDGVQVGYFPDLYAALAGNPPDQVITL